MFRTVFDPHAWPILTSTRYCAVYGRPIQHSASPAMQNAALAELGLNWRYLACEVAPEDLERAIAGAQAMRFIGLNLTVPHKLLAVSWVDELDESARTWGAVNTIRFESRDAEGKWRPLHDLPFEQSGEIRSQGFNTDADAVIRSIREDLNLKLVGARALLLGAGGAGRVAALKLAAEGVADLFLVNRTKEKAREIALEIGKLFPGVRVQLGYPSGSVDLLVNATSLGLKGSDPLPFDTAAFKIGHAGAVYDMIYRPAETRLLLEARQAGCRVANGLGMLLYQGAKALELWSGKQAPLGTMRQALQKEIYV